MTRKQLATARKRSADAFDRFQDDPDEAERIDALSDEEFAEERGIEIVENSTMRRRNGIRSAAAKIADRLSTEKFVVRAKDLQRAPVKKFKVRGRDESDALSHWKDKNDTRRYTEPKVTKNPLQYPQRKEVKPMPSKAELEARIAELEEENESLNEQLDSIAAIVSPDDDDSDDAGLEVETDEDDE